MDAQEALRKSFRAYDVRGIYPEELNEDLVAAITRAFIDYTKAKKIIIGRDARQMNPGLFQAALEAATGAGVEVIDVGLITTDMLYFAAGHLNLPGFSITASHNPANYSGVKMIQAGAVAFSRDTGLNDIRDRTIGLIERSTLNAQRSVERTVTIEQRDLLPEYLDHVLSFIDPRSIKPIKIVVNTMYGVASNVIKGLAARLPLEIVTLNFQIDGTFPKGPPNPMLPHLRQETADQVTSSGAALGAAWDGDADRVFFWDETGKFIEGYYIGVLLADRLLAKNPGAKLIHCARLGWLFNDLVNEKGGTPLECKVGHGFIKEMMRAKNAIFAEEMSGHYYFRDNFYADNGMIPLVLILEMLAKSGKTLGGLVADYQQRMIISGEINFRVHDAPAVVEHLKTHYASQGKLNDLDGVTIEFADWRFNVRPSNNEPLLRLNIEARHGVNVASKVAELEDLIGGVRADE